MHANEGCRPTSRPVRQCNPRRSDRRDVQRRMGRPAKHSKRDIVNAVLCVASTGCRGGRCRRCTRPSRPFTPTRVRWSRDGVWEAVADRLRAMAGSTPVMTPDPSASIIDARSGRGASTITAQTRGYDAAKKISGRMTFGLVDTLGLLIAVVVVVASTSDNTGGIAVFDEGQASRAGSRRCSRRRGSSSNNVSCPTTPRQDTSCGSSDARRRCRSHHRQRSPGRTER